MEQRNENAMERMKKNINAVISTIILGGNIVPESYKANYENLLRLLLQHQKHKGYLFYISPAALYNKRHFKKQQMEYKKFYTSFTGYLFDEKKLFDNYVGSQIKNLKVFFNWLKHDYGIHIGEFYKKYYVWKEEIPEPEIGYYLWFRPPINSKFQLKIRKQ
jgi:hypothetical protein